MVAELGTELEYKIVEYVARYEPVRRQTVARQLAIEFGVSDDSIDKAIERLVKRNILKKTRISTHVYLSVNPAFKEKVIKLAEIMKGRMLFG